jgi:hypothetical protein
VLCFTTAIPFALADVLRHDKTWRLAIHSSSVSPGVTFGLSAFGDPRGEAVMLFCPAKMIVALIAALFVRGLGALML